MSLIFGDATNARANEVVSRTVVAHGDILRIMTGDHGEAVSPAGRLARFGAR